MAKNAQPKAKATISNDLSQEPLEKIRQRAYELYEARGREDGRAIDDWLQAEAEIEAARGRSTRT